MPRKVVWAKPALEELGEELAFIRYADSDAAQALFMSSLFCTLAGLEESLQISDALTLSIRRNNLVG